MDVEFEIAGRLVVWDENKAAINKLKHRVSFETAARIFLDENFCEYHLDEDSYEIIGKSEEIIVALFTERQKISQLISARRANKLEEAQYYGQYSDLPGNEN